ncbi:hypothetical protein PAXINDRAFT_98172 [Paxillus involutus ATCC 200175]|nr:hypothetical protein PAXINDRAFT_98172 [Paxillus involutus ATCC 200175]
MPSTPTATADHSPQLHLLYSPTANPKSSSGLLVLVILFKRTPSRWTAHITIHLAISPRIISSEPTMEGLPHFDGTNPKSYTLGGAFGQDLAAAAPTSASPDVSETTHHDCQAQSACGWLFSDQGVVHVCGQPLSCQTAPEHFKVHGIVNMNKKEKIPCCWDGCREKKESRRSNFIRHIRVSSRAPEGI